MHRVSCITPSHIIIPSALSFLAVVLLISSMSRAAHAFWASDSTAGGLPLCVATGNQAAPSIVGDGAGGAYVAWHDVRGGNNDIYVQRVSAAGEPLWTADGLLVCGAADNQTNTALAADGAGVIVTWEDRRGGSTTDIYAQRLSAAGLPQWAPDGVALSTAVDAQITPKIISDEGGGAIVTWSDLRLGNYDIYAQRVSPIGAVLWTANGVAVCSAMGNQGQPVLAPDGEGGAIVSWHDGRDFGSTLNDIYAQRVNASGVTTWSFNGFPLCTAIQNQLTPTIVSDGVGGAIVTWYDLRMPSSADIYAQRVNANGARLWTANGANVCFATNHQLSPSIASDGAGGAIITWYDSRTGTYDIYAQRMNSFGSALWTGDGVALCTSSGSQYYPTIVSNGAGGAIVSWLDFRHGATFDVYAQQVSAVGATQWAPNGAALAIGANDQILPIVVIAPDGSGGAIVAWQDGGGADEDIYAQRVLADGTLPTPASMFGAWTSNGVGAATGAAIQQHPSVVSDTRGGAIFAWEEIGPGPGSAAAGHESTASPMGPGAARTRAVRIDGDGDAVASWPASGLQVSTATSSQVEPATAEDNAGGAIVVWKDDRGGNFDLYAQRVTAAGAIAAGWNAMGLAVCTATGDQQHPSVVPDGLGGVIVFWEDARGGVSFDIYAQRITGAGAVAAGWPANGVAVCTAAGDQLAPSAFGDGMGGALVSWLDRRGAGADIYALRLTSAGATVAGWTANGTLLCGAAGDQVHPSIAPDDRGGALVAWSDARTDAGDVYAQHVTGAGAIVAGWLANGNALCTAGGAQQNPSAVADGVGGVIVAWDDGRPNGGNGLDLYAQRANGDGAIVAGWSAQGMALCLAAGDQQRVGLIADGQGGAIASWEDARNGNADIFANQITAAGTIDPRWPANGIALCSASGGQIAPGIVGDGGGGAVVCWTDGRVAASDVYAFRIFGVGSTSPTSVGDAPVAQGLVWAQHPNPARDAMTLTLELGVGARVRAEIIDVTGRRVRILADGARLEAGRRSITWDARDESGRRMRAGIYFVRVEADRRRASKRFALVE